MDHWRPVLQQETRNILPVRVMEEERGDGQYLRRRISFFTQKEMDDLETGSLLCCGGHGTVRQVLYEGREAVVKEFRGPDALLPLMRGSRFMVEVGGAGGVSNSIHLLEPCCGSTGIFWQNLRQIPWQMFRGRPSGCRHLGEVHDKGIVHNDLKIDNVTFSGSVHEPTYHIIDLGWASCIGRVNGNFTPNDDDVCGDGKNEENEGIVA